MRFNPNLYQNGKVCLSILGTWSGPGQHTPSRSDFLFPFYGSIDLLLCRWIYICVTSTNRSVRHPPCCVRGHLSAHARALAVPGWSPVQSLASVLMSIQSLMNSKPYHNEPGFEVARNPRHVENYNDCIRFECLRVAVCDMVSDSRIHATMPAPMRALCRDLFPSFFDNYMLACRNAIDKGKDGQKLNDPFGNNKGTMRFTALLGRLNELQDTFLESLFMIGTSLLFHQRHRNHCQLPNEISLPSYS